METLNDYLIICESRYMLGHLVCNGFFESCEAFFTSRSGQLIELAVDQLLVHVVIFVFFYQFEHNLSPFWVKLGSKTFLDFLFHCFLRKQFTVAPV